MMAALASPQVEFARACGLSEWKVIRYALATARTPILTYAAILFGDMLGATAVIELIFSWHGIGRWGLMGVLNLDMPVIQSFVLITGAAALLVYICLDVVVLVIDPRVSYR
jgi:peptide/nickel transport system permease protein